VLVAATGALVFDRYVSATAPDEFARGVCALLWLVLTIKGAMIGKLKGPRLDFRSPSSASSRAVKPSLGGPLNLLRGRDMRSWSATDPVLERRARQSAPFDPFV
jgi:hypothetical protein